MTGPRWTPPGWRGTAAAWLAVVVAVASAGSGMDDGVRIWQIFLLITAGLGAGILQLLSQEQGSLKNAAERYTPFRDRRVTQRAPKKDGQRSVPMPGPRRRAPRRTSKKLYVLLMAFSISPSPSSKNSRLVTV